MTQENKNGQESRDESEEVKSSGYKFLWPKLSTPEWVSAAASVAAVIVAVASVVVAVQTRIVLDKQLGEMQSGARDTENLVTATQKLADSARGQAIAMKAQAKATGDLKDVTKAQAGTIAGLYGAIQSSANASAKTANAAIAQSNATQAEAESIRGQTAAVEKSLIASRDMAAAARQGAKASERGNEIANKAFLAAERPWVGVDAASASGTPTGGQNFSITITIKNTGRSPALNMRAIFSAALYDDFNTRVPPMPTCPQNACSSITILPNGSAQYAPVIPSDALTVSKAEAIAKSKSVIFVVGRIDYSDDSGGTHWTDYCAYWNAPKANVSNCAGGNDAN